MQFTDICGRHLQSRAEGFTEERDRVTLLMENASVSTAKGSVKLGRAKTGAAMTAPFSCSNAV